MTSAFSHIFQLIKPFTLYSPMLAHWPFIAGKATVIVTSPKKFNIWHHSPVHSPWLNLPNSERPDTYTTHATGITSLAQFMHQAKANPASGYRLLLSFDQISVPSGWEPAYQEHWQSSNPLKYQCPECGAIIPTPNSEHPHLYLMYQKRFCTANVPTKQGLRCCRAPLWNAYTHDTHRQMPLITALRRYHRHQIGLVYFDLNAHEAHSMFLADIVTPFLQGMHLLAKMASIAIAPNRFLPRHD